MILLDAEDQQHAKLNSYVAGPTVRLPERAAGGSSSLPDYETSQAQHTSPTISPKYTLHHTVDSRFWRATLYALAIYVALSVTIGIPLIITRVAKRHKSGPPPWLRGVEDSALSSPLNTANSGFLALSGYACNMWDVTGDDITQGMYTASISHSLRPSGSLSIRSNAWLDSDDIMTPSVSGKLNVDINPDTSASSVAFFVSLQSSSIDLRERSRVCFSDDGTGRGLSIYVPENITSSEFLSYNVTLLLPQSPSLLKLDSLITYLPMFSQTFGPLSQHVLFERVSIEGSGSDVICDSVRANQINIKNSVASIIGTFNVTNTLKLDTVRGPILANITVIQDVDRTSPTFFSLDTGDSEINARVILSSPTGPAALVHPVNFVGQVKNFNGPIAIDIAHDSSTPPVPLNLRVQNNQAESNVTLDSKYTGTFDLQTKLASATVEDSSEGEYNGSSKRRCVYDNGNTPSRIRGWVGWGEKPLSYDPRMQGHTDIVSSLSPILLRLGS